MTEPQYDSPRWSSRIGGGYSSFNGPYAGIVDDDYMQADYCTPENTRRFTYQREPYVRATIPLKAGGSATVDGKATRWCDAAVLVSWEDDDGHAHSVWVEPGNLQRIDASESSWRDVYDHPGD